MRTGQNEAAARIRTQDAAADWSMTGKTVLFTGASRGMGRFAAIELARLGAEILVVGHNQARGAAAVEAIRGTGSPAQFLHPDMGDAAQVGELATAVLARSGPVHVLIHSAGGLAPSGARTREGVDRGFAQNFLGAYLLTRLLEERLLASAPARVIAVGSGAHKLLKSIDVALLRPGTADPEMGSRQRGGYQMRSYQTAKLALTTWVYGLARQWAGRGVTAVSLDWGQWTVQAAPGTLTLRAEAADEASLHRIQDMLTTRLGKFGRREHLTANWQPATTPGAEPGQAG